MPVLMTPTQHKDVRVCVRKGEQPLTHVFTLSTPTLDRDGDCIDPHGWDLTHYKTSNPVVLWQHDYKMLPIGKCPDIHLAGEALVGTIQWPPEGMHPFADTVRGLVDTGFINSASVGFRALDSYQNNGGGLTITKAELLEWSIVNIPSNPQATLQRHADHARLKQWFGPSWREPQEVPMSLRDQGIKHILKGEPVSSVPLDVLRELAAWANQLSITVNELADRIRQIQRDGVIETEGEGQPSQVRALARWREKANAYIEQCLAAGPYQHIQNPLYSTPVHRRLFSL